MTHHWRLPDADEAELARLAQALSLKLRAGDAVLLVGELGAGKTTFARHLIRALLGQDEAEVPSPTFPILQSYDTPRLGLTHADLYRIGSESEAAELGLSDVLAHGALLIEWPEREPSLAGPDRLEIHFQQGRAENERTLTLKAFGSWTVRLQRIETILNFLARLDPWRTSRLSYLQGDASARAYARLDTGGDQAILMDWPRQPDGPPIRNGMPYSRIAHLAEGVAAFCDVAELLLSKGYSAPRILAEDREAGLLVIEDLGNRVFGVEIAAGAPMLPMWRDGVDVLVAMRELIGISQFSCRDGHSYAFPIYDAQALGIEVELLLDWYWPMASGSAAPEAARETFLALWAPLFAEVLAGPYMPALRDYHSPNLIWLPERNPKKAAVGLIDFQDAVLGHPAYDLVSLLQDARLDVPEDIETELLDHYIREAASREPGLDAEGFKSAYAILGAQRNMKILGIFARLNTRDGKPAYLKHIPRIWRYLERDLSHPKLASMRRWMETNFPPALRTRVLEA
jgi:hypothetical protein